MVKEVDCDMCSFMVRSPDDSELASVAQQHFRNMHQEEMSREDILDRAKQV